MDEMEPVTSTESELEGALARLAMAQAEERLDILQDLWVQLSENSEVALPRGSPRRWNLHPLFQCLDTVGEEEIRVAAKVLQKAAANVSMGDLIQDYSPDILRCFNQTHPLARTTNLMILRNAVLLQTDHPLGELASNRTLVGSIVQALKDSDLAVSKAAFGLLEAIAGIEPLAANPLFGSEFLPVLKELTNEEDENIRMRVYDLAVAVSLMSPDHLTRIKDASLLECLIKETITDDVLIQLNAIEVLTTLSKTSYGQIYLQDCNILAQLDQIIQDLAKGPSADLLIPGFIKLFGVIAQNHQDDCFEKFGNINSIVESMLCSQESTQELLALQTISFICLNPIKKRSLSTSPLFKEEFLPTFQKYWNHGVANLKSRALQVLEELITMTEKEPTLISEELRTNELIFTSIEANPLLKLLEYSRLPFPEVTIITHEVILKLVEQPFAVKMFPNTPGFMDSLLNRTVSQTTEVILLKFRILKSISSLINQDEIFPQKVVDRILQYVQQGPFHATSGVHVAFNEM